MADSVQFRWLGIAGVELHVEDQVLLIDPCLTRLPLWRMWVGRVHPNRQLVAARIQQGDFVLVTHAHWDHLIDVPQVVQRTGATALGSPNVCRLLATLGVPAEQIRAIGTGDRLALGHFEVEVLLADHITFPGWRLFSGPLPPRLRPPLRARDYRMDCCFSFRIDASGYRLLHRPGPASAAEALLVAPLGTRAYYEALLQQVQPQVVIPIHWDDLSRPTSKPVRPMIAPTGQVVPPLRRIDLARFKRMIEQIAPGTRVLIPEMFQTYDLARWKRDSSSLRSSE